MDTPGETPDAPLPGRWDRGKRDWAVSLWVAFLAACGGTFVLFALVDPVLLGDSWVLGWQTDLRVTYGLGFGFLYALALFAARLTAFMIRTGPRRGHARGKGRRQPPPVNDPADLNPDLRGEKWQ
jgi:hypothetical protein